MRFRTLFGQIRPVIGQVSLSPLPGAEGYAGDLPAVRRRAVEDAQRLVSGGCDAVLVENSLDGPFGQDQVPMETVAALVLVVAAVVDAVVVPVGVSVLRNDAAAAVAVATVAEARFVRVRVHVGTVADRSGVIEGRAADTLRLRASLRSDVAIFADVMVGRGGALGQADRLRNAHDVYYRGLADALVLSSGARGDGPDVAEAAELRAALSEAPLLCGGGVVPERASLLLSQSDGLIVDRWCRDQGDQGRPVDVTRVRELVAAVEATP